MLRFGVRSGPQRDPYHAAVRGTISNYILPTSVVLLRGAIIQAQRSYPAPRAPRMRFSQWTSRLASVID
jgi:hypothetical protein